MNESRKARVSAEVNSLVVADPDEAGMNIVKFGSVDDVLGFWHQRLLNLTLRSPDPRSSHGVRAEQPG